VACASKRRISSGSLHAREIGRPVVDFGRRGQLTAVPQPGDQHRLEVGAGGIDRGGKPRRSRTEDQEADMAGRHRGLRRGGRRQAAARRQHRPFARVNGSASLRGETDARFTGSHPQRRGPMPVSETPAVERIARVLAGQRLSINAKGSDPSAGPPPVKCAWPLRPPPPPPPTRVMERPCRRRCVARVASAFTFSAVARAQLLQINKPCENRPTRGNRSCRVKRRGGGAVRGV
jgi:hypothetical protein